MTVSTELIVAIAIAVVTAVAPGLLAMRQARNVGRAASKLESKKVDAEAYERARIIYEASIHQLEATAGRQATEVVRLGRAVARLEKALEESQAQARVVIRLLRERIYVLEALVRQLGGIVPEEPTIPPVDLTRHMYSTQQGEADK